MSNVRWLHTSLFNCLIDLICLEKLMRAGILKKCWWVIEINIVLRMERRVQPCYICQCDSEVMVSAVCWVCTYFQPNTSKLYGGAQPPPLSIKMTHVFIPRRVPYSFDYCEDIFNCIALAFLALGCQQTCRLAHHLLGF